MQCFLDERQFSLFSWSEPGPVYRCLHAAITPMHIHGLVLRRVIRGGGGGGGGGSAIETCSCGSFKSPWSLQPFSMSSYIIFASQPLCASN